jgi:hypothetical protein
MNPCHVEDVLADAIGQWRMRVGIADETGR